MLFAISGNAQDKLQAAKVTMVTVAESNGKFTQTGDKTWTGKVGNTNYELTENKRGKWDIFLTDNASKLSVFINLWTKEVKVDGKVLYSVSGSSDAPIKSGAPSKTSDEDIVVIGTVTTPEDPVTKYNCRQRK